MLERDNGAPTEDWKEIRRKLGKLIFPDQEKGRVRIVQLVSMVLDKHFKGVGCKTGIEEYMPKVVGIFHRYNSPITIQSVSRQVFFEISDHVRRTLLTQLVDVDEKSPQRSLVAGVFDVLEGFEMIMVLLRRAYDPRIDQGTLEKEGIRTNQQTEKDDPKGFLLAKDIVKLLSSSAIVESGLMQSYKDPELIAAGVKLGAETYKRMYPIAERVLSAGS
jgi:hypothetical protein